MKKEKIHTSTKNIDKPNQATNKETKNLKNKKSWFNDAYNPKLLKASEWLGLAMILLATAIYVILGSLMHNWAKTWMIFIFAPVIPSILTCIAKRDYNYFGIAFLIAGIYCAIGMNVGIWHPTWVMFFGIILYHGIVTWIMKSTQKPSKGKSHKDIQAK